MVESEEVLVEKLPDLAYRASRYEPGLDEKSNPIPLYVLRKNPSEGILIKPAEGLYLSLMACIE